MEFSLCLLWRDRWGPNSVNLLSKQPPLLFSPSQTLPCCGPYASNGGGISPEEGAFALAAAALVSACAYILSGDAGCSSFLASLPACQRGIFRSCQCCCGWKGDKIWSFCFRRLETCLGVYSVPDCWLATALLPVVASAISSSAVTVSCRPVCF